MIRVTVELLPHGKEEGKRTLGVMLIANDATGNATYGNYVASMMAEYGQRAGVVRGFNRKSQSVWSLVGSFLKLWGHTKHAPKLMEQRPVEVVKLDGEVCNDAASRSINT